MPVHGDQYRSNIENPFEEKPPRLSNFTAQEIATLQSRLNKQLGPEYVSTRPGAGGGKVAYLAAEKAINLANEVFGFNGWSSSIQQVQIDFVDENPSSGKISLGLSIIVRVTLKDGSFHEDIGYGHIENCKGKAAAFEKAKKEAATDALKRALRTFGNVLGNCLYDKDYLKRVGGIKAPPAKWDVERLHRHPDFAPVKQEGSGLSSEKHTKLMRGTSEQSVLSAATEFEDEFGGNLFDGVDISENQGDDFTFDASEIQGQKLLEAPPQVLQQLPTLQHNNAHIRQPMSRVHSMPAVPPQSGLQQGPQAHSAQPTRPPIQARGAPQTPNGNQNLRNDAGRSRTAAQQHEPQHIRPQQHQVTQNQGQARPQQQHQTAQTQGQRSNPHSSSEKTQQHQSPQIKNEVVRPNSIAAPPTTHEPPPGFVATFVTSRAAELIQNPDNNNASLPPNLPKFDPHAESPSIRRTGGIDHKTSAPVTRQLEQLAGSTGPVLQSRPNFVHPQADANRRIGMPVAHSPLSNRGAYKPPGMAAGMKRGPDTMNRAPLTDVSNKQAEGSTVEVGDGKRIRHEGTENDNTVST